MHSFPDITLHQLCQMCGVVGFLFYVGAFAALQLRYVEGRSLPYIWANILAASLVMVSLLAEFNLASALIQTSWIVIGVTGLMIRHRPGAAVPRSG